MNFQRYNQIESGLSSIARKVLAYVPISESWTRHQIGTEIERQSRARVAPSTLDGVLMSLVDSGLVKQPSRDTFRRLPPPERSAPEKAAPDAPSAPSAPTHQKEADVSKSTDKRNDPMSRIANAAVDLKKEAFLISECVNRICALSDELELASIEVDDLVEAEREKSKKVRQLQQLLKTLGD